MRTLLLLGMGALVGGATVYSALRGVRRQAARYRDMETGTLNAALKHRNNQHLDAGDHLKRAQARLWWANGKGE